MQGIALQYKASHRTARHCTALHRKAKQRGKPVTRVCRVVLAQVHSIAAKRKEWQINAWQRGAPQRTEAHYKATRVIRHADIPSRFDSKALHGIARKRMTSQRTTSHGSSKQRGQSVQRQIVRVVLAQGHCKEGHRITWRRTKADSNERQVSEWHRKATRSVHPVN